VRVPALMQILSTRLVIIATEVTVATGIQTCTVALRVVRGLEKETQCLGV
jgi:hypothetical protein